MTAGFSCQLFSHKCSAKGSEILPRESSRLGGIFRTFYLSPWQASDEIPFGLKDFRVFEDFHIECYDHFPITLN